MVAVYIIVPDIIIKFIRGILYLMLSAVLMLHHIGESERAAVLEKAIAENINEGKYVTYDLKPDRNDPTAVGTSEFADAIVKKIN